MTRSIATIGAVAALATPAIALAAEQPTPQDRTNAASECRAERGTTPATREAFAIRYGTNKNKANAFGKCVSQKAKAQTEQQPPQQS